MYITRFSKIVLLVVIILGIGISDLSAQQRTQKSPNIVLFLADDLTWQDSEPYGNPDVQTPNIERLADQGMTFRRMYTSTAMCSPTRQQLYTGMYPVRNGGYPNHSQTYQGVKSLPHHLTQLGYRVGITGKRHFGPPSSFPFQKVGNRGEIAGNLDAINKFVNKSEKEPFALVVAAHQPHKKWTKGNPSAYDPQSLEVPPYLLDTPTTRRQLARYYAEVTYMDTQFGRVLDLLNASGIKNNTIVIFTSEQGAQFPFAKWTCYENGLRTAFIVRWPAPVTAGSSNSSLLQYVDVVPTIVDAAGGNPDTVQTGRADAYGDTGFDGQSFLPLLQGQQKKIRNYVYGVHTTLGIIGAEAPYPIRSVSDGRYKLIINLNADEEFSNITKTPRDNDLIKAWKEAGENHPNKLYRTQYYYNRPPVELYDLQKDPNELHNLAGDPAFNQIVERLKRKLDQWMEQQGDKGLATERKAKQRIKN